MFRSNNYFLNTPSSTRISIKLYIILVLAIIAESFLITNSSINALLIPTGLIIIFTISEKAKVSLSLVFFYLGTFLISLTTSRIGGELFNISDLFYLLSTILLCAHLLVTKTSINKVFIKDNPLLFPLLVFLLGAILSMLNSIHLRDSLIMIGKYVYLFGIWLPLGIFLLDGINKIKMLLLSLILASLIPIFINISDYFFNTEMTATLNNILKLNLKIIDPLEKRFGSIMGQPNNFATLLTIVFPIGLGILMLGKRLFIRFLGLIYLFGILISFIITGSRSCLLAVALESALLPYLIIDKGKIKVIVISLFMTFSILYLIHLSTSIFPQSPLERLYTMMRVGIGFYEPDIERIVSIKQAWIFIKDNPINGIGVEHTSAITEKLYVHNTILRLWASLGIFGLIAVLWFYAKPILIGIRLQKKAIDRKSQKISAIIITSMAGWMLFDMFQPQFHNRVKWIIVIALFSMLAIYRRNTSDIEFS